MKTSTEGDTNLYRLVTQNRSADATADAASIELLLAPIGVTVVGAAAASMGEFDGGPGHGGATVTLINLNVPIDLPVIDHVLQGSPHQVVALQPVAGVASATR